MSTQMASDRLGRRRSMVPAAFLSADLVDVGQHQCRYHNAMSPDDQLAREAAQPPHRLREGNDLAAAIMVGRRHVGGCGKAASVTTDRSSLR